MTMSNKFYLIGKKETNILQVGYNGGQIFGLFLLKNFGRQID